MSVAASGANCVALTFRPSVITTRSCVGSDSKWTDCTAGSPFGSGIASGAGAAAGAAACSCSGAGEAGTALAVSVGALAVALSPAASSTRTPFAVGTIVGLPLGERRSRTTRTLSACSPTRACETTPSAKLCFTRFMPLLAPNRSITTRSGFFSSKESTLSIGPLASISTPEAEATIAWILGALAGAATGAGSAGGAAAGAASAAEAGASGATSGGPGWLGVGAFAAVPLARTSTTISSPCGLTSYSEACASAIETRAIPWPAFGSPKAPSVTSSTRPFLTAIGVFTPSKPTSGSSRISRGGSSRMNAV